MLRAGPGQDVATVEPDLSSPQRTVIVIEDRPGVFELLCELMNLCGFNVVGTKSPRQAIDMATAAPPDLFIINMGLPGSDGVLVAQQLRRHGPTIEHHDGTAGCVIRWSGVVSPVVTTLYVVGAHF